MPRTSIDDADSATSQLLEKPEHSLAQSDGSPSSTDGAELLKEVASLKAKLRARTTQVHRLRSENA